MLPWTEFISAGLLFLLTHRVPTIPAVRQTAVSRVGERAFVIGYSLVSFVMLAWLIAAAARAPYVELWPFAPWQTWVPFLAMPFACCMLVFSIGVPNPLSFAGGDGEDFDPARPGFVGFARHGLLWALAVWSAAHIPPNGDLAHVILFGVFAAFAIIGMTMIDHRKRRQLGDIEWMRLAAKTSFWPGQSIIERRWRPFGPLLSLDHILRAIVAALVFAGLMASHARIIGVGPWPW